MATDSKVWGVVRGIWHGKAKDGESFPLAMNPSGAVLTSSPIPDVLDGVDTGVNGVALTATTNSNVINTDGARQVVLRFKIVNGGGAAIPVVFYVDSTSDDDPSVFEQETIGTDGAASGGVVTTALNRRKYSFTTAAAATTQAFTVPIPGLHKSIRVSSINAAGAGATDLVTLRVRVGY